jgi:hypothetical protein
VPLAAIAPPVRLTLPDPATAVAVPPHVFVKPFGVDTTSPAGSVSPKPIPVSVAVVLLFWIVKAKLVDPLTEMLAAPNALMITGGPTTVIEAVDVLPVPASVDVT